MSRIFLNFEYRDRFTYCIDILSGVCLLLVDFFCSHFGAVKIHQISHVSTYRWSFVKLSSYSKKKKNRFRKIYCEK